MNPPTSPRQAARRRSRWRTSASSRPCSTSPATSLAGPADPLDRVRLRDQPARPVQRHPAQDNQAEWHQHRRLHGLQRPADLGQHAVPAPRRPGQRALRRRTRRSTGSPTSPACTTPTARPSRPRRPTRCRWWSRAAGGDGSCRQRLGPAALPPNGASRRVQLQFRPQGSTRGPTPVRRSGSATPSGSTRGGRRPVPGGLASGVVEPDQVPFSLTSREERQLLAGWTVVRRREPCDPQLRSGGPVDFRDADDAQPTAAGAALLAALVAGCARGRQADPGVDLPGRRRAAAVGHRRPDLRPQADQGPRGRHRPRARRLAAHRALARLAHQAGRLRRLRPGLVPGRAPSTRSTRSCARRAPTAWTCIFTPTSSIPDWASRCSTAHARKGKVYTCDPDPAEFQAVRHRARPPLQRRPGGQALVDLERAELQGLAAAAVHQGPRPGRRQRARSCTASCCGRGSPACRPPATAATPSTPARPRRSARPAGARTRPTWRRGCSSAGCSASATTCKPLRGSDASDLQVHEGSRSCRSSGFSHHPYTKGGSMAPTTGVRNADEITLNYIGRLERMLDAAGRYGRIARSLPIYDTEYGFQTNPPDKFFGVSLEKQATYINEADYMCWRDRRIRSVAQYNLIDDASTGRLQHRPGLQPEHARRRGQALLRRLPDADLRGQPRLDRGRVGPGAAGGPNQQVEIQVGSGDTFYTVQAVRRAPRATSSSPACRSRRQLAAGVDDKRTRRSRRARPSPRACRSSRADPPLILARWP